MLFKRLYKGPLGYLKNPWQPCVTFGATLLRQKGEHEADPAVPKTVLEILGVFYWYALCGGGLYVYIGASYLTGSGRSYGPWR